MYNVSLCILFHGFQVTNTPPPCISGGRELEGAGPSPLNYVSDSNMCPTENRHFFTLQVNISVSVRVLEHFFISSRLFLSIFFSLFLPFFFLYTFFPFPTHFFFSLLSSVLCPTLSCVRRQGLPGKARKARQIRPCL